MDPKFKYQFPLQSHQGSLDSAKIFAWWNLNQKSRGSNTQHFKIFWKIKFDQDFNLSLFTQTPKSSCWLISHDSSLVKRCGDKIQKMYTKQNLSSKSNYINVLRRLLEGAVGVIVLFKSRFNKVFNQMLNHPTFYWKMIKSILRVSKNKPTDKVKGNFIIDIFTAISIKKLWCKKRISEVSNMLNDLFASIWTLVKFCNSKLYVSRNQSSSMKFC